MQVKELNGGYYGRVSTEDQARNGGSPKAQRERCLRYIDTLNQYKEDQRLKVKDFFADDGYSGKDTNRPEYQRMWKMIERRELDFIVTTELSRLSRSVIDFLSLIEHCEKHECAVHIIGLNIDTSNPFGKVIVTILVALAQFEREMVAMRTRETAISKLLSEGIMGLQT